MLDILKAEREQLIKTIKQLQQQQQYIDAQLIAHQGALEFCNKLISELQNTEKAGGGTEGSQ